MSFFRNVFLLLLGVFLLHSCAIGPMRPMVNKASSKVGDNQFSFSIELINIRENQKKEISKISFDDINFLIPTISYSKKINKDTSYEFYLLGIRRVSNIYRSGAFYFDNFASIYSFLFINGVNIGFITGLNFKHFNIYTSTKFEPLMFLIPGIEGSESGIESFISFTSAIGVLYTFESFSVYFEASTVVWDKKFNKINVGSEYSQLDYIVSLGLSF